MIDLSGHKLGLIMTEIMSLLTAGGLLLKSKLIIGYENLYE